jgi:hypothetical protein
VAARMVELRVEIDADAMAVMDGYCSARGKSRTDVLRQILGEWSDVKLHEATVICRTAGRNPFAPESNRDVTGGGR